MSTSSRTTKASVNFQFCKTSDPKQQVEHYDIWAKHYDKTTSLLGYRAPHLAVDFLSEHFCGHPEETQVLDVACGTGWVAKLMTELGFRSFVGVDGSKGMLEFAAKTGLYQDLKLALLGTQPLPAQTGVFDVVIIIGALDPGFVPVSVIRELCNAAKPGGLVCMARGKHTGKPAAEYEEDLHREFQLMEEEGLWNLVGTKHFDRYMENPHVECDGDGEDHQEKQFISGTVYLYRKSSLNFS
ncbi:methyltransferase-like protein 27 [Sphaeramia orbicularis]|uniref:Methyltransferase-like protein 27 n=1 Tax=Sphaeramia orbicularis TaxID=375764 RepID=A0A673ALW5_9TELE|nr:methyltransferase-like protein 27 [Sphaeramia orbicularis]XP_030013732.1 methyltransferase-like protein 27 [Sphaeramia orbicularis]